jgi:hypothetical protein
MNDERVGLGADLEGWVGRSGRQRGMTTLLYAREWNYQADQRMNGMRRTANCERADDERNRGASNQTLTFCIRLV